MTQFYRVSTAVWDYYLFNDDEELCLMSCFNLKKNMTGILARHYSIGTLPCQRDAFTRSANPDDSDADTRVNVCFSKYPKWTKWTIYCFLCYSFPLSVLLLAVLLSLSPLSRRSRRSRLLHFGAYCNLIKSKKDHAVEVTASQWMVSSLTCYPSGVWHDQWFSAELQNLRARPKYKTPPTRDNSFSTSCQRKFHTHLRAFCMCWLGLLNIF